MKNITTMIVVLILLQGGDCEIERLESLNCRPEEVTEGILRPIVLPSIVIGDSSIDCHDEFYEAIDEYNEYYFPRIVFVGDIDDERFVEIDAMNPEDRNGIVLTWVEALPDPWDEPGAGGYCDRFWNSDGEILRANIIIDDEISYDCLTYKSHFLHELGHALGIGHAQNSIDLNSCMASPPFVDCELTCRMAE